MSGRDLQLVLPARAEDVAVVRHALAGLAEALDMDPAQLADLKTVVTEACMNAVVHAYEDEPGPMEVDAYREDDALVVERARPGCRDPPPNRHRAARACGWACR